MRRVFVRLRPRLRRKLTPVTCTKWATGFEYQWNKHQVMLSDGTFIKVG